MLNFIRDTLDSIKPIPLLRFETAQAHLDSLTKPPGSLGLLEDLAKKYAAIRDTDHPSVNRNSVIVFAADHGVTEEGISAFLAIKLNPAIKDYIFSSHRSVAPGHEVFFDLLQAPPLFDLKMRLGEGTGAVLAFNLIEAAVRIYSEMATFQSAGISDNTEG